MYLQSVTVATESTGSWYWLMAHIKSLNAQANLPSLKDEAKVKSRRHKIPDRFLDDDVRLSVETDLQTYQLDQILCRAGR